MKAWFIFLRRLPFFLKIPLAVVLAAGAFYCFLRFSPYRDMDAFLRRPWSLRLYDRNGALVQITALEGGLRREYRPLSSIPPELAAVFVYSEDRRFFSHPGVDPLAILRALIQNIRTGRRISGASTITMQLARLIAAEGDAGQGPPRLMGLGRKIAEAWNAMRLEARLSKNEILELYLNSVPFGFQTEGVSSAARNFFAAEVSMLSPGQIFCLAVIPRRPAAYNPLTQAASCAEAALDLQRRFVQDAGGGFWKRRGVRKILARSGRSGGNAASFDRLSSLEEADWRFALGQARRFAYPFEAPHLARLVAGEIAREGGAERPGRRPLSEIALSLDLELQHYLEGLIAGNVIRHYGSRITNGAAIALDNSTGEILAWVGSADYHNAGAAGQIDGVLALNQPGSSMKPFLYALALERGFRPADVLADVPMNFGAEQLYIPQNFNNRFNGPMLFRAALASSLNIPAVYLLYRLGVENYRASLVSLGFRSLEDLSNDDENGPGLGLALGNAPVSLAELAGAFSVFPRDGLLIPLTWEKAAGSEAVSGKAAPVRVMESDTARLICSFLSDRSARVLAFGAAGNFSTPFPAIFKTGTANQYQSIVALAAAPSYTVAIWMGNFTGETVIGRTGSSLPAAIARDTLVFLQGGGPGFSFPEPEGFTRELICALSGMRPTPDCPSAVTEYIAAGEEREDCTWHRSQAVIYPAEYQSWFFSAERRGEVDYSGSPLEIVSPRNGFTFFTSPGAGRSEIPVEVQGGAGDELEVFYAGEKFTVSRPFIFYLPPLPGSHTLTVRNGDETAEVSFRVE